MSANIIVSFALLFGAVITLICAVYSALYVKEKRRQRFIDELKQELIDSNKQ